jgi:hypothetical protein
MTEILTPKQVMDKYSWSYMTWYRRREECLLSDYKDAIILESQRSCRVKADRFQQFLDERSAKIYKERFGIS